MASSDSNPLVFSVLDTREFGAANKATEAGPLEGWELVEFQSTKVVRRSLNQMLARLCRNCADCLRTTTRMTISMRNVSPAFYSKH